MAGWKNRRPVAGSIGWVAAACAARFFASAISLRWYNLQPKHGIKPVGIIRLP